MSERKWMRAMGKIDDRVIERYMGVEEKLSKSQKTKRIWLRMSAIAACACLVFSAVMVAWILNREPQVPVYDEPMYSAEEIADMFPVKDGATNAYVKVYVPDSEYLYISDVSNSKYISIFEYDYSDASLDSAEFTEFVDSILPNIAEQLDENISEYKIDERYANDDWHAHLSTNIRCENYYISVGQYENKYSILINDALFDGNIILDGERVCIDQRQSDKEIIKSLKSIKQKLFEMFDVDFSDAKVVRSFNGREENGADWIEIYFYDEKEHSLNSVSAPPISDYIAISFDNSFNYEGDIVSDSILTKASVNYVKSRNDIEATCKKTARAKMISLEEAEELLYKGYVFSGHTCQLCMEEQDKVDFTGYDFVGLAYIFARNEKGQKTLGIPFYAFYKEIGSAENGNRIYAKTYVPAVQVSGMEEYFKMQEAEHR